MHSYSVIQDVQFSLKIFMHSTVFIQKVQKLLPEEFNWISLIYSCFIVSPKLAEWKSSGSSFTFDPDDPLLLSLSLYRFASLSFINDHALLRGGYATIYLCMYMYPPLSHAEEVEETTRLGTRLPQVVLSIQLQINCLFSLMSLNGYTKLDTRLTFWE